MTSQTRATKAKACLPQTRLQRTHWVGQRHASGVKRRPSRRHSAASATSECRSRATTPFRMFRSSLPARRSSARQGDGVTALAAGAVACASSPCAHVANQREWVRRMCLRAPRLCGQGCWRKVGWGGWRGGPKTLGLRSRLRHLPPRAARRRGLLPRGVFQARASDIYASLLPLRVPPRDTQDAPRRHQASMTAPHRARRLCSSRRSPPASRRPRGMCCRRHY